MESKLLSQHLCSSKPTSPFLILNQLSPFTPQNISLRLPLHRVAPLRATTNSNGEDIASSSTPQPVIPPPQEGNKVRLRRVSRRRGSRDRDIENNGENNKPVRKKAPPKDWDDMTYGEKAMELYVGEKGLLFWLNKFAYASIYIIIGAWIIFRFVGPSLGFYQLDTPPLSPTDVLKGG